MKRNTGFVLLATAAIFGGLLFIPTSEAGNPNDHRATQVTKQGTAGRKVDLSALRLPLTARSRTQQSASAKQKGPLPQALGQASVLNPRSSLSASLITAAGGRGTQFSEVALLADWDGREDYVADRAHQVDDFSFIEADIDQVLTRVAISEHTYANGFEENVYYYGDSVGNVFVGTDTDPALGGDGIDSVRQLNIPELVNTTTGTGGVLLLNPQGTTPGDPITGDCTDDQVIVTGIAVNPVADLGDFGAAFCGTVGEVVYVSVLDTGGCSRNGANQIFRTRIFAFGFQEGTGADAMTPLGAIQIVRNPLAHSAGPAVDDDGSLYFQLSDRTGLTGSAIFKVTETGRTVAGCLTNPRVNRVISSVPSGLTGAITLNTGLGTTSAPILTAAGMRLTNFSGNSTTFGNVMAMTFGPNNVLYAALSRSFVSTDDAGTQATEGLFANPSALGPTPSMIISFADTSGAFDACSSPSPGVVQGQIRIEDGFADQAKASQTRTAGVNNFRVFALGNGPTIGATAADVLAITPATLSLDMQIDATIYAGIAVDEERTVYVVSGGTPAGVGNNPSPQRGEILAFPDCCVADRRADYLDLRGNALPNPPASGGNVGDGDSDRFDHIYWQAPVDGATNSPTGVTGLARGFLLYTNRTRNRNVGSLAELPNGGTQGDDSTTLNALLFEDFDAGHQVAGGDDQNTPFRGDDNDGQGNPVLPAQFNGGFEFSFGGPVGVANSIWNGFFLNSNGNITFGAGENDNSAAVDEFRTGLPKIAAAWNDLNPGARAVNTLNFPVQALGFAGVNAFKIRSINVPEFGSEGCSVNGGNTFATILLDDGTGRDENEGQTLNPANPIGDNVQAFDEQEGPNDLRFVREPNTGIIVGEPAKPNGTGAAFFDYGQMLLLGTPFQPVITGFSAGGLAATNPPGMCANNLGEAALAADTSPFGVIQGQTASILPCLLGEGTEPTLYELFNTGQVASVSPEGVLSLAVPSFDLRAEGNDPLLSSPGTQGDLNRGNLGLYGLGSLPPPNPIAVFVSPNGAIPVAPGQPAVGSAAAGSPGSGPGGTRAASSMAGTINALGPIPLNLLGSGFFPNEITTVCSGEPEERPGKTVTTAMTMTCDTNNDGIAESVNSFTSVVPMNKNLVRGTLPTLDSTLPGTSFPLACSGGFATITLTTTVSAGDNNIFGPFTRTAIASIDVGLRAPVVLSINPTSGDSSLQQTINITGSSFIINGTPNVTSVYAVELNNPGNVIQATSFNIINAGFITSSFNFGPGNAGRTFLIFASGPNGTSRNLTALPPGTPAGVPLGNEAGNLITFTTNPPPTPDTVVFSNSSVNGTEGCASVDVTVSRFNPSAGAVTVDYATSDGSATHRRDYQVALGTLTFGPGETSKTIPILINEDSFMEGNENFTLILSNPTGGAVIGVPTTITIIDDDFVAPTSNPIDDAGTFVCQQYHDFLNRQPDGPGLTFWTNEITSCGANAGCIEAKRVDVSAAFFLSIEFQETGFYVLRAQRAAFGRKSAEQTTRYPYFSFLRDGQQVGRGVVIGAPGADALLEANKQAYAVQVVTSAAFITNYPLAQTASEFVDALFATAGVTPTATERTDAIAAFGGGGTAGRVAAFRKVTDATSLRNAEFNPAFVLLEYYGYLRRNPTDAPDVDDSGYQFWLNKLNDFGGNYVDAEMVKAFISSIEYRQRFGP